MKVLIKKARKCFESIDDLRKGSQHLHFESLSEDSKKDYYNLMDAMRTFLQNLPEPQTPKNKK